MAVTEGVGATFAFGAGFLMTINFVLSKTMKGWDFPYFFLVGCCSLVTVIGLGLTMAVVGPEACKCQPDERKWVVLRGFFGAATTLLSISAALAGAPMGSIGALSSVNTVVAALLGRVVLGEPLGKLHILAISFSVIGAVLISDPQAILGGHSERGLGAYLGFALAILGGISMGLMFIASRKSTSASSLLPVTSANCWRWVTCWILAFLPFINDGRFQALATSPVVSFVMIFTLFVALLLANFVSSLGAQLCPAIVSATIQTAANMFCGYLLDILLFHEIPNVITILGALMMLLAVVTVAAARLPPRHAPKAVDGDSPVSTAPGDQESPVSESPVSPTVSVETTDTPSSLFKFIAEEFAERQVPYTSILRDVRQRAVSALPAPAVLGASA